MMDVDTILALTPMDFSVKSVLQSLDYSVGCILVLVEI